MNELTLVFERLSNQARFIQMFIKGQIKISNCETAEIVRDLRKLEFRPFPKVAKVKVAANPDDSVMINPGDLESEDEGDMEETDDLTAAGSLHDYDYLLEMSISSLTASKVSRYRSMVWQEGVPPDPVHFGTRHNRPGSCSPSGTRRRPSCTDSSIRLPNLCGLPTWTPSKRSGQ